MSIDEFIKTNPSREEIAAQICYVANAAVLDIDNTFVWSQLSKLGNFTADDFWDDQEKTIDFYEPKAVTHYGIVNWKLKDSNIGGIFKK